jgi:arsenate reductase-like glutaredoxin family protein
MKIAKNEILFIYNSQDLSDRQALGYISCLPNWKIKEVDLDKESFTELQIKQLADMLNVEPKEIVDQSSDLYKKMYASASLSEKDMIKALSQSPKLIKTPIAVFHNQAKSLGSPYQVVKWDMNDFPSIKDYLGPGK